MASRVFVCTMLTIALAIAVTRGAERTKVTRRVERTKHIAQDCSVSKLLGSLKGPCCFFLSSFVFLTELPIGLLAVVFNSCVLSVHVPVSVLPLLNEPSHRDTLCCLASISYELHSWKLH